MASGGVSKGERYRCLLTPNRTGVALRGARSTSTTKTVRAARSSKMSQNRTVPLAVQRALAMGAAVAGGVASLPADAQEAPPSSSGASQPVELQEVVITGSRVRRVDTETASPVFVLDQSTIAQTGAATVGDLVDRIPAIGGEATNPSINNGGGFGETNIELRGLGVTRTLILIDGQRVNLAGASGAVDVNQIPLNSIDHV